MENLEKQIQEATKKIAIGSTLLLIYSIIIMIWSSCNGCLSIETNQFVILIFGITTGKLTLLTAIATTTTAMSLAINIHEALKRFVSEATIKTV